MKTRRVDIESLVAMLVTGMWLGVCLSSRPQLNFRPNEPRGVRLARIAIEYQDERDAWCGPFMTSEERERRKFKVQVPLYQREIANLKRRQSLGEQETYALAIYQSNLTVAVGLSTNREALLVHMKTTGLDQPMSWRAWIVPWLFIALPMAVFLFSLTKFIKRLVGTNVKDGRQGAEMNS